MSSVQNASGKALIAAERERQIAVEGWPPEHDDQYVRGELAAAGSSYRIYAEMLLQHGDNLPACFIPKEWPFERRWWKPSPDPVRNLVKAGALFQAQADLFKRKEIDDPVGAADFCVHLIARQIDRLNEARAKQ